MNASPEHMTRTSRAPPREAEYERIVEDLAYRYAGTVTVLYAADVIATMGCGHSCPVLPGAARRRYQDWDVDNPAGRPIEAVRRIRDNIQARVTALLADVLDH